ncbi:MAG TPA: response regulator [Nevskiaceae bacterium]|nr:response regulator [Nevskiaceae bacterium]
MDDSKSARFALRRYLEGHQYKVDTAESADEAFRFLQASRPEVIFLDHIMPGIDGFEALRTLKADATLASIPVVICSSNEGPDFNTQARNAGASGVLQKPPNPDQLTRILIDLSGGPSIAPAMAAEPVVAAPAVHQAPVHEVPVMAAPMAPPVTRTVMAAPTFPTPSPETAIVSGGSHGAPVSAREDAALREQLDARLKKVSQGLLVQFAEIKATVAHLSNQQNQLAEQPAHLARELRSNLEDSNQTLRMVTSRVEGLEREVFSQLTAMRSHMEMQLKLHAERVSEIVQFARQAAAEEAQVVAERTVMSAALRISDQLADAILGAVGRR